MTVPLDRLANQLDWNLLRTFMVIVQERSVTLAADRLAVTQPTISAALRRLEERLGCRLIERGGSSGFRVTRSGEILYREAVEIYGTIARLGSELTSTAASLSGTVAVHVSNHLAAPAIHAAIAAFRADNPGVEVMLTAASCEDVSQALNLKTATIGVATWSDPSAGLLRHAIADEPYALYCGPGHPFHDAEPESGDLAEADLVTLAGDRSGGALGRLAVYRQVAGLRGRIVGIASDPVTLLRMVEAGMGVGLLPLDLAERSSRLRRVATEDPLPVVPAATILNPQVHFQPGERAFLEYLIHQGLCPPGWRQQLI